MTVYSFAEIDEWINKVEKRKTVVAQQATNDLFQRATRTSAGITRGGRVKAGYIPRDTGFLAASSVTSLNGTTSLSGENAHVFVIGNMKAGDQARIGWTAPYARKLHYAGWLWVDDAAQHWQSIVTTAARKARAAVR